MEPAGSACHAVVRWVITPLAASPASFQPSKAAMMTGAVSLPVSLSSIAHHLLTRRLLAMPVSAYVLHHDHWLTCPVRTVLARGATPGAPADHGTSTAGPGGRPPRVPVLARRLTGPASRLGTL